MNSVISAFKTKKNSSSNAGSVQTMANNDKQHNSLGLISSSLSTTSSKKKAINAQDNSYQYLRHIREIDTATKLLSPVVMADDLLETEMLNFRPATVTPMTSVDVVDHVPILQTVRITSGLDRTSSTDCNMNGSKQITCEQAAPSAVLENGNCNEVVVDSMTALNGQLATANSSSPTPHLVDIADDDESEHSITACTSTTSSNYMPAFLKSSHVTLPIIMPNSNSSLATLPTSNQCINSAATTPKHSRYSKPRLSLSRFINHSMPSVHGRSNMSIPGAATSGAVAGTGSPTQTNGTNPPKRASTHQRNLSLDFSLKVIIKSGHLVDVLNQ
uniref:Uncharacterized protein n=1 Tax=Glossina pallidipes TaxID=7398 RepID=A0A1B0AFY6_GLOPL